jgi:DnaJ-class molecular chaperone
MKIGILQFFTIVCFAFLEISCLDNPYNILGVDKKSTITEIKKAYKQLAKEW